MEFINIFFDYIVTILKWVIFYPILAFICWEVIISQMFGISFWTIMGLSQGSKWALKNFSPKQQPARNNTSRSSNPRNGNPRNRIKNNNQDLFYEDA